MTFTLYEAIIPTWCQLLRALSGLIDKAGLFCVEQHIAPEALLDARLAPDMLPLAFQLKSATTHSAGAIEGVRAGVFRPDPSPVPASFEDAKARVEAALAMLEALDPAEVESFIGHDMRFEAGGMQMPFAAEAFLLSFSQPNFHFHVVTAYDILRHNGMAIGKRDFAGQLRTRTA